MYRQKVSNIYSYLMFYANYDNTTTTDERTHTHNGSTSTCLPEQAGVNTNSSARACTSEGEQEGGAVAEMRRQTEGVSGRGGDRVQTRTMVHGRMRWPCVQQTKARAGTRMPPPASVPHHLHPTTLWNEQPRQLTCAPPGVQSLNYQCQCSECYRGQRGAGSC